MNVCARRSRVHSLPDLFHPRRLQSERNKAELRAGRFGTRIFLGLRYVYRTSGVRGLWRGIGPHLAGTIPARAIYFGVYHEAKKHYVRAYGHDSPLMHLGAAVSAGLCTQTLVSPLWVIKTRMQLQTPEDTRYRNAFDCARQMLRHEGWRSLFRGLSASLVGISESSLQFVLYEKLKKTLATRQGGPATRELDAVEYVGAAGAAKLTAVGLTYPHEVIRTRMRQAPEADRPRKYVRFFPSLRLVAREEGRAGLYGGMGAHMIRVVPNAVLLFVTYEVFVRYFALRD